MTELLPTVHHPEYLKAAFFLGFTLALIVLVWGVLVPLVNWLADRARSQVLRMNHLPEHLRAPCADCGHWLFLHDDSGGYCASGTLVPCVCVKFRKGKS